MSTVTTTADRLSASNIGDLLIDTDPSSDDDPQPITRIHAWSDVIKITTTGTTVHTFDSSDLVAYVEAS